MLVVGGDCNSNRAATIKCSHGTDSDDHDANADELNDMDPLWAKGEGQAFNALGPKGKESKDHVTTQDGKRDTNRSHSRHRGKEAFCIRGMGRGAGSICEKVR